MTASRFTLIAILLISLGLTDLRSQGTLVFSGVNVIPMDEERVLRDQTVVIDAGRIVSITPAAEADVPGGAQVIDAGGHYLMPGLAEMHAHMPGQGDDRQYREDVAFLYLANGVTLARSMLGAPVHLQLRQQLADGSVDGPRLISAGPGLGGNVQTPADGIRIARQQAEAGYDLLKIFWGMPLDAFNAMAEAAHAANIEFSGHVPGAVGVPRALEAGYSTIDHFDAYMPTLVDPDETEGIDGGFFGYRLAPYAREDRLQAIVEQTKEAGVWNVPTETIMHSAFAVDLETVREERPEFRYMPQNIVDGWINWVTNFRNESHYDQEAGDAFIQVRLDLIKALHDAGAGLLLGSDAPQWFNVPGFSVHREMAVMESAGLSPYEVLRTGTVNPAVYLGEEDVFGRVAEGLKADLVLLRANPLEDLANAQAIEGVVRHGRWFSRETLDERLEAIAERNR